MRANIPTDIWHHIASFIPPKELRNLYGVNRVFFQLALDERYRQVDFLQVNPRTLRFLEHVRNPHIASRVRRLRLNPVWFNLPSNSTKPSLPTRTLIRRLKSHLSQRLTPSTRLPNPNTAQHRDAIDAHSIALALLLPNITSFVLATRYAPHPPALLPFLTNAWHAFGPVLTRLTLNAPLSGLTPLLPAPSDLPALHELTLRFSTDMTAGPAHDTNALEHTVAPFLHALAPRLHRLTIMSSALGDHTSLFTPLLTSPAPHYLHLTTLSLDIGFYPPLLSDSAPLTALLQHHAPNLIHARFQPHESVRAPAPAALGPAYAHFRAWMEGGAADPGVLVGLKSLVVSPAPDLEAGVRGGVPGLGLGLGVNVGGVDLGAAGPYLLRSRDTLTSLVLGDRCLSFAELGALVGLFAHRPVRLGLKTLYVKLLSLNPQVFDVLAEKLPGLEDLDIKFNTLLADAAHEREDGVGGEDRTPDTVDIDAFLAAMAPRIYPHWALDALWIWQRSHMTTQTALEILERLRSSIPAVRVVSRMDHGRHSNSIFN